MITPQRRKKLLMLALALFVTALGMKILSVNKLTFGGTAGIAFLLSYTTVYSWGFWFVLINLPFCLLSYHYLGPRFTASTVFSIIGISLVRELVDYIPFLPVMTPAIASLLSGLLIGIGISLVLYHGSSLGGMQILAVFLDQRFSLNRGITIFVTDFLIIVLTAIFIGWSYAIVSIMSIAMASLIIGRYRRAPRPAQPSEP
jgi:uncharacterized membrane-anchored protein YitT (DUF2179 family)